MTRRTKWILAITACMVVFLGCSAAPPDQARPQPSQSERQEQLEQQRRQALEDRKKAEQARQLEQKRPGAARPQIAAFDVQPSEVQPGESAILSWTARNAQEVSINNAIGPVPPHGELRIRPATSQTYTLTAVNDQAVVTASTTVKVVYPRRRPHGSPARPSSPSEVAEDVLAQLKPGKITYDPPREMKVAVPTSIQVRIGKLADSRPESDARLNRALTQGLERPALAPEAIRVSTTMKALLTAPKDEFQIELKSPEEQIISSDAPTEWRWLVTPLKPGKRRLHLSAIAVVKIEGSEKVKEFGVYDTDITVKINVLQFLTEHWKEISSAVSGTGLMGWLLARFRKRKRQTRRNFKK